jgi:hypothetical protein
MDNITYDSPRRVLNTSATLTLEEKTDIIIKQLLMLKSQPEVNSFENRQKESVAELLRAAETGEEVLDYLIDSINQLNVVFKKQWEISKATSSFDELRLLRQDFMSNPIRNIKTHGLKYVSTYEPICNDTKQQLLEDNLYRSNERRDVYNDIFNLLNEDINIKLKFVGPKGTTPSRGSVVPKTAALTRSKTTRRYVTGCALKQRALNALDSSQDNFEKNLLELKRHKRGFTNIKDCIDDIDKSGGTDRYRHIRSLLDNLIKTTNKYNLDDETFIRIVDGVCKKGGDLADNKIIIPPLTLSSDNFCLGGNNTNPRISININNVSHISNKSYNINKRGSKKSILAVRPFQEDIVEKPTPPEVIMLSDKIFDSFAVPDDGGVIKPEEAKKSFGFSSDYFKKQDGKKLRPVGKPKKSPVHSTAPETIYDTLCVEEIDTFRNTYQLFEEDESIVDSCDEDGINYPRVNIYLLKVYKPIINFIKNENRGCVIEDGEYTTGYTCMVSVFIKFRVA